MKSHKEAVFIGGIRITNITPDCAVYPKRNCFRCEVFELERPVASLMGLYLNPTTAAIM
jgi:hypothetical protein